MRLLMTTLMISTLTLSACGFRDSRANPANWFGNSRSQPVDIDQNVDTNPLIPQNESAGLFSSFSDQTDLYTGTPIDQVTELVIERVPGGAVVRATGVSDYDGPFGVRLTPTSDVSDPTDGIMSYTFEAERPRDAGRTTSTRVRTVTAAVRLTDKQLARIKTIRVDAARNAQTTARR
jgi:hypothetical protein